MDQNQTHYGQQKQWEVGTTLTSEDRSIEVKVNVLRISRPLYSIQVCGAEGSRFLRVTIQGQGRITVQPIATGELVRLLDEAQEWIRADRQKQEDVFIARAMEKEAKFDKGKVEHKHTGKTEKNRERRRGGVRE